MVSTKELLVSTSAENFEPIAKKINLTLVYLIFRWRRLLRGVPRAVPRDLHLRFPLGSAQGAERASSRRLHLEALGQVRRIFQGKQRKWRGEQSEECIFRYDVIKHSIGTNILIGDMTYRALQVL